MKRVKEFLKRIWLFIKNLFGKSFAIIKRFLSFKKNRIIAIVSFAVAIVVLIIVLFPKGVKNKFALDDYYGFAPAEVRKVYSNLVKVSCGGDLKFDIDVDSGEKKVSDLSKRNLLDYMFSYLDKNDELTDKIDDGIIKKTIGKLFEEKVDLLTDIKDYNYGEYTYDLTNDKITRKKHECTPADTKHVLHLYGYSSDKNYLYMDINVAYLKDGILYDYNDKQLGEYDENVSKLPKLTEETSYYHLTYLKDNDDYRLVSVEWRNRS